MHYLISSVVGGIEVRPPLGDLGRALLSRSVLILRGRPGVAPWLVHAGLAKFVSSDYKPMNVQCARKLSTSDNKPHLPLQASRRTITCRSQSNVPTVESGWRLAAQPRRRDNCQTRRGLPALSSGQASSLVRKGRRRPPSGRQLLLLLWLHFLYSPRKADARPQ